MAKGGARNRSGPGADPTSGRSEARGLKFTALPAEGYRGEVPGFPLAKVIVRHVFYVDGERIVDLDEGATEQRWERELDLWAWAWATPQAAAWAVQPWRHHSVAMWVRTAVLCESADATAADKNSLHRFADQIGLTPAGLKENGWAISVDELAERRGEAAEFDEDEDDPRSRMTAVPSGGA